MKLPSARYPIWQLVVFKPLVLADGWMTRSSTTLLPNGVQIQRVYLDWALSLLAEICLRMEHVLIPNRPFNNRMNIGQRGGVCLLRWLFIQPRRGFVLTLQQKKLQLHSWDTVFIPINENHSHWYSASINFCRKRIDIYDSLRERCLSNRKKAVPLRRNTNLMLVNVLLESSAYSELILGAN